MCISPADGHLYVSDPEKHQILKALTLEKVENPTINIEPVVGSGERCIPGDRGHCGDEGPAIYAKLAHPKGIIYYFLLFIFFLTGIPYPNTSGAAVMLQ